MNQNPKQHDITQDMILNVLQKDPDLRHKKPFCQEFIDTKLPKLKPGSGRRVRQDAVKPLRCRETQRSFG